MKSNMRILSLIVFSIMTFILFFSCIGTKREEEVAHLISEWSGKEILFPKDMCFTVYGKDTVKYPAKHSQYSIVCYMDSAGCTSCKLQPQLWKKYISLLHTVDGEEVPVLIFMHLKDRKELITLLENNYFNHPVCMDEGDMFNRLNHFPSNMAFQTFLLDQDNKVIAIGNPVHNIKIGELYRQIIQGEEIQQHDAKESRVTKVKIEQNSISLGSFDWKTKQEAIFILKNMGGNPLYIEDVGTSCGCTSVSYLQESVLPGKEIKLKVIYEAKQPEYFNEVITVHCNVESSPLILNISGDAK